MTAWKRNWMRIRWSINLRTYKHDYYISATKR